MRLVPVRLGDVSPRVRVAAASREANRDPGLAAGLLLAAIDPSPTTYWVSEDAFRALSAGGGIVRSASGNGVSVARDTLPTDPEVRRVA